MAEAWQTDVSAAQEWADEQIDIVSGARGWPVGWITVGQEAVGDAAPSGFWSWFAEPAEFFENLAEVWSERGMGMDPPAGWDELGRVWASAGNASYTAAEEIELQSLGTQLAGTATASVADVSQAGAATAGFFSPTKGWLDPSGYKFWLPVAGIGVGCWLWKR